MRTPTQLHWESLIFLRSNIVLIVGIFIVLDNAGIHLGTLTVFAGAGVAHGSYAEGAGITHVNMLRTLEDKVAPDRAVLVATR